MVAARHRPRVDAESFRALQEDERQGFTWIFAHRFQAEFNVATVLAPFVTRAPDYELQVCLATQIADEFRHLQCVLRVYDEVFGIRGLQRVQADRRRAPRPGRHDSVRARSSTTRCRSRPRRTRMSSCRPSSRTT